MSDAEVLIPHPSGVESLREALLSLEGQTLKTPVTVVDNGSTDGSTDMVASEFPRVSVLSLGRNFGFGAALNRAVAESNADLLVFMNNDARADRRFVEELTQVHERSGAAMVAGALISPSGRVESLGVEIDSSLNAYDVGFGLEEPGDYAGPPPLGPCGGAALYHRRTFIASGGFDEAFFAYLEDVDLAIRLRGEGCECATASNARAWHHHSATLGSGSGAKNELLGFARARLLWKYGAALSARDRWRGHAVDLIVGGGKIIIDRNAGTFRGAARHRRVRQSNDRQPDFRWGAQIAPRRLGFRAMLSRRLARRR